MNINKEFRTALFVLAALPIVLPMIGCGSGSGGGSITPPTPVITSVSMASQPSPAVTTAGGGKVMLTPTAHGSNLDASLSYGTWTVNGVVGGNAADGTITSAGVYTPPQTVAAATQFTIAVNATDGPAIGTGTISVTVNPAVVAPLSITSVNVTSANTVYVPGTIIIGNVPVNGTGFQIGCVASMGPNVNFLGATFVSSTQLLFTFAFDSDHWDPGLVSVSTTCSGVTSNTVKFAFLGIMNQMVKNSTDFGVLDQQAGLVRKYKIADGSADGTITVGGKVNSIALDDVTGDLVAASNIAVIAYSWTTGVSINGVTPSGPVGAVSAKGHYACFSEYTLNNLACFDLTQGNPTVTRAAVSGTPWNVNMTTVGGNLTAVVWSNQSNTLATLAVPSLNVTGMVTIPGLTPAGSVPSLFGGWQLVTFDSGPGVGTAAVLSAYDGIVNFVNLTSSPMIVTKQVTLTGVAQGTAFRMAGNLANGSVVVAIADPTDALTKSVKVSSNGTVTALTNTAPSLATGFSLSADGTKIYAANRSQSAIIANQ